MEPNAKILLVEDDEEDYLIVHKLLSQAKGSQFDLVWASSYEQGIGQCEQNGISTVLVDYSLGERNGLDFVREISARATQVPMILLTGQGSDGLDLEGRKGGTAVDYLAKDEINAPLLERAIRYAIERRQSEARLQQLTAWADLLANLSKDISKAGLDYRMLLGTITRRISEKFGDAAIIRLLAEDGKTLEPIAVYHPDREARELMIEMLSKTKQRVGEGLVGEVALTREPRLICGAEPEELIGYTRVEIAPWLNRYPTYSLFVAPLCSRERLIGTMVVVRSEAKKPFTREDQGFYLELADRTAMAIENVHLFQEEQRKAQQMKSLHAATQSLAETLEIDELYRQILAAAQQTIPAMENGILHLFAPQTGELEIYVRGLADPAVRQDVLERNRKLVDRAIRDRKTIRYEGSASSRLRSGLIRPLILRGKPIGALSLFSARPGAFRQDDLPLLDAFAATTIATIQNARLHQQVQEKALTDALTGLLNRRGFLEVGKQEMARHKRYRHPLSMILLDIDQFKTVNDSYGHSFGDEVLKALSESCATNIRNIDIAGRYGGDEFVILLPETDLSTAEVVAHRIHECFGEKTFPTDHGAIRLTASLGVAKANRGTRNLDELIINAETALYTSKEKGRNRVEIWGT